MLAAALAIGHASPQAQAADVLRKMVAVNATVRTYQVRIHFDAKIRAFISLPLALNATYYFKRPDKAQIKFDTVPLLARQFKEFYASIGTPATWPKDYVVTLLAQPAAGADTVVLKMVPKASGSLDYAILTVDTNTYGIAGEQWQYRDGSRIDMLQENEIGPRYVLPKHQVAEFSFPRYKAHIVADFGPYQINVPIPDSVFKK